MAVRKAGSQTDLEARLQQTTPSDATGMAGIDNAGMEITMEPLPQTMTELCALVLSDEQPSDQRIRAAAALGDRLLELEEADIQGSDALQCLVSCIRTNRTVPVVVQCVGVLGRVGAHSTVPVLIDVLLATHIALYELGEEEEDPDSDWFYFTESESSLRLRSAGAQALGRIGDERAIVPLMSILNDREVNYRLRLAAAESLGKIGGDHAVTPLLDIIKDDREKSTYLKESAVKALGMLGDIRAIEPLLDVLESKRGIRDKFNFLKEQVIEAIARIGQPHSKATDTLIYALSDRAPSIRLSAVEALGEIGDGDCVAHLQKCVFDSDDDVARAAICSIYNLAGEVAIRELLAMDNIPQFLRDELESYIP